MMLPRITDITHDSNHIRIHLRVRISSRRRRRRKTRGPPEPSTMSELTLPPSSLFAGPYNGSFPLRELPRWKTTV
eukprot:3471593-Pyramimonas_sp.AAC.1